MPEGRFTRPSRARVGSDPGRGRRRSLGRVGRLQARLDPICAHFEVISGDTFSTGVTFALPVYRWGASASVAAGVLH